MLRSMYSGISGMKNFQTKLDVIGNNIANVNTPGFKKGRVTFKDTMNQTISGASASTALRGGKNPTQVGLGSTLATIDTITTGSSLQTTSRPLDLGIDGDGYFVVKQGDAEFYTRAGNFYLDDTGTLVNADGLKVQAYKYDDKGNLTNVYGDVSVNVNAILPAVTTKNITFSENLSADANVNTVFSQQLKVVDKNGDPQAITIYFKKTAQDKWDVYIDKDPNAKKDDGSPLYTATDADVNLDFSGTTVSPAKKALTNVQIPSGLKDDEATATVDESKQTLATLDLDFTKLTQNDGATTALVNPDGNTEGKLESFSVGSMGEINGVYSNGQIVTLGRLAIAKFSNSSGLNKAGSNLFQETVNSGTPDIAAAGEGRGTIASGSLEMSNVDLSEEFTEMITAQRGFQANTRIITTSDEILQELVNLKR
ncbi:flagellar basal-body rod protein FlgF [Cytobacillus sp. Hz8]|uniref:flagellar basal-body rod protein FlgF n=1 Tax=Cytobacillus sp. Hz8 TaxID=3347168 RepID=UPI0035D63C0C